jgi:NNP family nitrate/nitrite transporter-like MFS transporter
MSTLVTVAEERPVAPDLAGSKAVAREKLPLPVILINTFSFALAFAAWVAFGPSIRFISQEMGLSLQVATLIKTLPILVGSAMRLPLGIASDRIGARVVFPLVLLTASLGMYAGSLSRTASQFYLFALVIGMAGTTFIVGVQSVSSWTAKNQQGFALGIFGTGNVGTALTTFGLPLLLSALGWRGAFRVYACVLCATAVAYALLIRNAPRTGASPSMGALLAPLKKLRTWRFGLYYMATFGVFVATTLSVSDIYVDAYHVSVKTAGLLATTFTFSASMIRMAGGKLSDIFGARRVVRISLITIVVALTPIAAAPPLAVAVCLVFAAGCAMGIGMAGVFRYIPDYFPASVGAVGGVVGALGGLGGFFLPQISAWFKTQFGSTYLQILPLAALPVLALAAQYLAIRSHGNLDAQQQGPLY